MAVAYTSGQGEEGTLRQPRASKTNRALRVRTAALLLCLLFLLAPGCTLWPRDNQT